MDVPLSYNRELTKPAVLKCASKLKRYREKGTGFSKQRRGGAIIQ